MSFDINVSLEETALRAWAEFGAAWSSPDGGIGYGWLYDVQGWTMPGSKTNAQPRKTCLLTCGNL